MPTPIDQHPAEDRPLACDMTAIPPERRAAHQALAERLFGAAAVERRDLPDGYAWRFAGDLYPDVAAFIADERRCCPFFTFTLIVARDGGPLWLHLTGDGEIKPFIEAELGITPTPEASP
jgi:hypothetical protein